MKFTSKDLMKTMKLSVGDGIKLGDKIFEIYISPQNELRCVNIHNSNNHFYITNLIDKDFEILPRPKRVGDLKCLEYECAKCPLRTIRCDKNDDIGNSLYYILDNVLVGADFDQEIHDLLKARLDKEVE